MGRTGLVTDITMIEDYPQNYFTQTMRQRRWIRGDWQLLPWLLQRNRPGMVFSSIDRWKMFDNLRRAMLAPSLMLIVILGILFQPSFNLLWTTILLLTLGIPIFTVWRTAQSNFWVEKICGSPSALWDGTTALVFGNCIFTL